MVFVSTRDNNRERPSAYRNQSDRERGSSRSRYSPTMSSSRFEDRFDEHRSRREESSVSSKNFSNFYRERFGSHSPEDYRNLRISQFDRSLSKNEIRNLLEREFKQFSPFEIKIVHNPENDERLAYVNFERDNCAKTIRRTLILRLQKYLGRRLALDPTGVMRDQDGKYIPDRFNRAVMAADRDYYRDRSPRGRRRSSSRDFSRSRSASPNAYRLAKNSRSMSNKNRDSSSKNPFVNLNQDDTQATRTLYIGNLLGDVRESEIRRVFEVYGIIDEIEVKVLSSTAAFAFILYRTVEGAIEGRRCQNNMPIRPGSTRCQIGYSKTKPSNRLYVGGLGAWATKDMLESEFDRYGAIDDIEYSSGDSFAYIRFVDLDSACDACAGMKNFKFANEKFITVDFAKDYGKSEKNRKRDHSPSSDCEFDLKRTHTDDRSWSPTTAGYIETYEELRDKFACTWKGCIRLKKVDYPMSLHRIFGKEHLLQDYLRDESGNSLKLNITQRVKLDQSFYQEHIGLGSRELALMIAASSDASSEKVIQYLLEKNAAGLVSLNNCTVHFLPYSVIAERLLKFFAPRIAVMKASGSYMLIVLRKNSKDKSKNEGAQQSDSQKTSDLYKEELLPPPPLPSLRVKSEDDDKLEQMHQERLKNQKIKKETASHSPQSQPSFKDEYEMNYDEERSEKNGNDSHDNCGDEDQVEFANSDDEINDEKYKDNDQSDNSSQSSSEK